MKLCDVNVLVYAHRADSCLEHRAYADWITNLATGEESFGISELVLSGFVRAVTNPRVFKTPTSPSRALAFCDALRKRPQAVSLVHGPRSWAIFARLCRDLPARRKLVADAWHAALAIEHGCEWISTDGDFARFTGLKWTHPLKA